MVVRYPSVYALSKRHGPPATDLRDAEILDDYGDTSNAGRRISHRVPEDVTREDLDCYYLYAFLDLEDLLFYLYPVALEYEKDPSVHWIDYYLWSLERFAADGFSDLPTEDRDAVLTGFRWIVDNHQEAGLDCPNLLRAIGIEQDVDDGSGSP